MAPSPKSGPKIPKWTKQPHPIKRPSSPMATEYKDRPVAFTFIYFDPKEWGTSDGGRVLFQEVIPHLINYERRLWGAIEANKERDHPIPRTNLCKEAQDRLDEIKGDDIDDLWSFHLTGLRRIWGVRDQHYFRVLWWDPEHRVCPSPLKHT